MQTRTYKDLFRLITSMIGTGGELPGSGTEDTQVADFINRRFQQAFDQSPVWPRYLVVGEPRTIVPGQIIEISEDSFYVYGAGTSAANGLYQRNLSVNGLPAYTKYDTNGLTALFSICSNVGNTEVFIVSGTASISNPAFYSATLGSNNEYSNLSWSIQDDPAKGPAPSVISTSNIGDFKRIYKQEPFLNNSAIEYEFFVTSKGANILNLNGSGNKSESKRTGIAFVSYKKQFTPFTVTTDFYNSTVEVPGEFFNFIAHAVYADFLRVQNRQEQALAEEQVAQTYLALELEKIDIRSNNNTINKRFSTYVNRQSR